MHTPNTSSKALREFAIIMAFAFTLIFYLLLPWVFNRTHPLWPLVVSGILLLQAAAYPPSLIPIQSLWMRLGAILGWINTRVILALVFFLVLTPIGWLQRRRNKLQYQTGYDPKTSTYKILRKQPLSATDLEHPF